MKRGVLLGFLLLSSFSAHALERGLPICFLPGAGGGNQDSMDGFRDTLAKRGVTYHPFELGKVGTVIERARIFTRLVKPLLDKDPSFRCHAFAYSMGGPVARYSYHHLDVTLEDGTKVPVKNIFASLTSFSSPHRGTPLAEWLKRYSPKYAAGMDDLSAEDMRKYNDPAFPETYSPEPTDIPAYSYQTFITKREEGDNFLAKFGFQVITEMHKDRGLDPRNDGVVPTESQSFGGVLGLLKASHGFFSYEIGLRPTAPDFFETHWYFLNGERPSHEAERRIDNVLKAKMFSGAQMLRDTLGF